METVMIEICHVEILSKGLIFPDPDGEGEVQSWRGEIRLMRRDHADGFLQLDNPPIRLLSLAESGILDNSAKSVK